LKVLYGVSSNGQGHINRSRIFIDQLIEDGHEVDALLAGKKPPDYAFNIAPRTIYRPGLFDLYKNHKVSVSQTLMQNLIMAGEFLEIRRDLLDYLSKKDYDVFFTDFEHYSSYIGRRLGLPVVCINRQMAIYHPLVKDQIISKGHEILGLRMVYALMQPYYTQGYALDFVQSIKPHEDVTLFPLVWKPEFDNYEKRTDNHITAYLAWYDYNNVVDIFTKFPDETFYVYGFNKKKTIKNIVFKETSREGFIKDLVSCKAIIGNAGFNLSWEACLLKKPIWAIPIESQYEQIVNAYRLEQLGLAHVSYRITEKNLAAFLQWIEKINYKPNGNITVLQASDLLNHVYDSLTNNNHEDIPTRRKIRRDVRFENNKYRIKQEIR
jgi:uncharacterized protein (TIGR00661 family)